VCTYSLSSISNEPIPSKSQLRCASLALLSASTLHGFACASCTELGSTVNPAARTVATANTATIKTVVFFIVIKTITKVYVYLSLEGYCYFLEVDISEVINQEYRM